MNAEQWAIVQKTWRLADEAGADLDILVAPANLTKASLLPLWHEIAEMLRSGRKPDPAWVRRRVFELDRDAGDWEIFVPD